MGQDPATKLDQILDSFDTAMLINQADEGIRARPMTILDRDGSFRITFVTDRDGGISDEVEEGTAIALTMQNDAQFLAMRGQAFPRNDKGRMEEIWTEALRPWFPEGPGDPSLQLVDFEPEFAEFWDVSGAHRLGFLWEAGKAVLEQREIDPDSVGEHERIRLRS